MSLAPGTSIGVYEVVAPLGAVYGFEQSVDSSAIVRELIEGETLAERIHREPMHVQEALQVVVQVAEAPEAAHGKAIIHVDLKPANIKITFDIAISRSRSFRHEMRR